MIRLITGILNPCNRYYFSPRQCSVQRTGFAGGLSLPGRCPGTGDAPAGGHGGVGGHGAPAGGRRAPPLGLVRLVPLPPVAVHGHRPLGCHRPLLRGLGGQAEVAHAVALVEAGHEALASADGRL